MISPLDPYKDFELDHDGELEPIVSYAINGYFEVMGANQRNLRNPTGTVTVANRSDEDHDGNPITNGMDAHEVHLAFHSWEAIAEGEDWWHDVATDRAGGVADYLFGDGHVSALSEDDLTPEMAEPGDAFHPGEDDH